MCHEYNENESSGRKWIHVLCWDVNVGRNFLLMLMIPLIYLKCTERLDEPLMCFCDGVSGYEGRDEEKDGWFGDLDSISALYPVFVFCGQRTQLCAVYLYLRFPPFHFGRAWETPI